MRTWNLQSGDPMVLLLAADRRLTTTSYTNDHIWELLPGSGDPAALVLQTSYGLRARNMRVFPLFEENEEILHDPAQFATPPQVTQFFPNYLALSYAPFPGLEVQAEYWAPESNLIAGRIRIQNIGDKDRHVNLELASLLTPAGAEGQAMLPVKKEAVNVLQGRTENLEPVLFLTGGPQGNRSPYTSLVHKLHLKPGSSRRFTWVLASCENADISFRTARQTAARNWEAELARLQMTNEDRLVIETGDPDWDATFAFGQNLAQSLIHTATGSLPHDSFVQTRLPDQGYSAAGDGSDHSHLWDGQTPLDAWYLIGNLLPGDAETAKGILLNYIATQDGEGHVDFKPGMGGQRTRIQATPLITALAWQIYEHTLDKNFLADIFPHLLDFIQHWFDDSHDTDGDGIPEWTNLLQTGFDDNPTFARWAKGVQGADIAAFESPDLCAYLVNECNLLINMAKITEQTGSISPLEAWRDNLISAVEASWNARAATYNYWDRDTHQSPKGERLAQQTGSGEISLDLIFDRPHRILLNLENKDQNVVGAHVFVHGRQSDGQQRVERFGHEQIHWLQNSGTATSQALYAELENIQIEGLPETGKASVHLIDYRMEDHTLLLPLWAGIPDAKRAEKIIQRKLNKPRQYLRPYGIPACPKAHKDAASAHAVWLPWNTMIGFGLLRYDAHTQAADLVSRIMSGIVANLKREGAFRKHYFADKPQGFGDRNALAGLPPLALFLETLGVRILSPYKVILRRFNNFPWPIRLKYKGLIIRCEARATHITFPNGEEITVDQPGKWLVDGSVQTNMLAETTLEE